MRKPKKLRVGDTVTDAENSARIGTITFVYQRSELEDIVAVRWNGTGVALAYHIDDLTRVQS